ncbi:MAG: hypothetical protein KF718_08705 [Polyangiaceae bacterium]|nr:hypothetical protein [Polyangiaceae bacterium]
MGDVLADHARYAGLGRIDERIPLSGQLSVGSGPAETALVRTPRGIFLLAASDAATGRVVALNDEPSLRYESGRVRDRLHVAGEILSVPALRGERVKEWLGLARLTPNGRAPQLEAAAFVLETSPVEAAWLGRELAGEPLLAYLDTDLTFEVHSALLGRHEQPVRCVLTPTRLLLVAIDGVGDATCEPLEALTVTEERGGCTLASASFSWRARRGDTARWLSLAPALAGSGVERALEVARLEHVAEARASDHQTETILAYAREQGDVRARLLEVLLALGRGVREPELPGERALLEGGVTPAQVAELWQRWQFSPEAGYALVERLRRRGVEGFAIALHRGVHAELIALRQDDTRLAEADAALAEHLVALGLNDEARALIESRLALLPREAFSELLPPKSADLTQGAASPEHRVVLLELLNRADDDHSVRALRELAELEPLVPERLEKLAKAAEGGLKDRAEHVLEVLAPGGIAGKDVAPLVDPSPLGAALLERKLRHPIAREGTDLLGRLQALLGAVPVPDHRALSDYVEPISEQKHPDAARALSAAARLLDVSDLSGFISRGRKGTGIRSYEGASPFVLVGGRHLDPNDEAFLSPSELCFAIGTEVAHLRCGHSRVTSSEVWSGALEKSKQGLDLALGVLPLFRGVRVLEQVTRVTSKVPFGALGRTVKGAFALKRGLVDRKRVGPGRPPSDEGLSALNEQLVAAHRAMQLTADRAGLLLARDPRPSVRAMLHVRPDHRELYEAMLTRGIDPVLAARADDGALVYQDLAIRIAALVSFYISEDYERLERHALGG